MSKGVLTKREKSTLERAKYMQAAGKLIQRFIESNWKSLDAVAAITQEYYPLITRDEIYNFWSYKTMNTDLLRKMDSVLQRLKAE